MEPAPEQQQGEMGERVIRWLCTASFVNQGFSLFMYLLLLASAGAIANLPLEEVQAMAIATYGKLLDSAGEERMHRFVQMLHGQGAVLFGLYALRTVARAYGTWRMWKRERIGLHIYVSAQLLGVLVPMLVLGRELFDLLGFIMVLNWCYLYWSARRVLH